MEIKTATSFHMFPISRPNLAHIHCRLVKVKLKVFSLSGFFFVWLCDHYFFTSFHKLFHAINDVKLHILVTWRYVCVIQKKCLTVSIEEEALYILSSVIELLILTGFSFVSTRHVSVLYYLDYTTMIAC